MHEIKMASMNLELFHKYIYIYFFFKYIFNRIYIQSQFFPSSSFFVMFIRNDCNTLRDGKFSIILEILKKKKYYCSVNFAVLKLDYKSVAPVANCISDLQARLGLAGEEGRVPRIWRERGKACQRAMGGTFYRFIHYPLSDLTRRPSIRQRGTTFAINSDISPDKTSFN